METNINCTNKLALSVSSSSSSISHSSLNAAISSATALSNYSTTKSDSVKQGLKITKKKNEENGQLTSSPERD